ncbi:MAG: MucBP domain-containing protein [Lachnospiraceae bacterium]
MSSGSTVTFNLKDIQVTDDKYYVKGIRLSGRDNEEALASPVLDNRNRRCRLCSSLWNQRHMVAYTVNYQDASGKALAESQTFYGNVGDKPIVAYQLYRELYSRCSCTYQDFE